VVNSEPFVFENTKVLPRAYFVEEVKVIDQEADFYNILKSRDFDPAKEAQF